MPLLLGTKYSIRQKSPPKVHSEDVKMAGANATGSRPLMLGRTRVQYSVHRGNTTVKRVTPTHVRRRATGVPAASLNREYGSCGGGLNASGSLSRSSTHDGLRERWQRESLGLGLMTEARRIGSESLHR